MLRINEKAMTIFIIQGSMMHDPRLKNCDNCDGMNMRLINCELNNYQEMLK
jgi:hypothetical protein